MPPDSAPINLTHHFLIAMPGLEDASFARSVVYLCEHSERGALGLIINKPSDITLKSLFDKVDLSLRREDLTREPVFQGGPVQTERGFVLHPTGHSYQATLELGELALSTSQDVLFAMGDGGGPEKSLICLGYAGWEAGQLEAELADNAWLSCPADSRILFDIPAEERLSAAAASLGINLSLLTAQAGHA